jgi:hypothetical protein
VSRWALVAVSLVACDVRGGESVADPAPASSTGDTAATATEETGTAPTTDAGWVEALLAGEVSLDEAMAALDASGGLPVRDGGTLWFVHAVAGGDWALAGDFNGWEPAPMTRGDGFWWASVEIEEPNGQGYKFVDGGQTWIADPAARSYVYDAYGELSFVEPPADRWRLDRWRGVAHGDLAPRAVHVYVPPGAGPFPVLYAHDGQNLFDPAAPWGGWRLAEAVGGDVLVVGIDNTADRMSEYTHVDDEVYGQRVVAAGDQYAALVHERVRPMIESHYGSTGHDGLLGSSLGGLISLHVAWRYPGEYDFVASLSGTLGWGRFVLEQPAMEARWVADRPDVVVYVDSGGGPGPDGVCADPDGDGYPEDDPDSSDNYCETRQFADALAAAGYSWDSTLFHWHEPGATHDEAAWAQRVHRPLAAFLNAR